LIDHGYLSWALLIHVKVREIILLKLG